MSPSLQLTIEESSRVRTEWQRTAVWCVTLHCLWFVWLYMCEFTRLLVESVSQREEDNAKGNEGRPPSQQEHDNHTAHSAHQRQPLTVEPEGWTPTCRHTHIHMYTIHTQMSKHPLSSRNSAFSWQLHFFYVSLYLINYHLSIKASFCVLYLVSWWLRHGSSWSWSESRSRGRSWRWWERWCSTRLVERKDRREKTELFLKL